MCLATAALNLEDAAHWAGDVPHLSRAQAVTYLPFQLLTKHFGTLTEISHGVRTVVKWERRSNEYGYLTTHIATTLEDGTLWEYHIRYTVLLTPTQPNPTQPE
jgi:hypothetical protein